MCHSHQPLSTPVRNSCERVIREIIFLTRQPRRPIRTREERRALREVDPNYIVEILNIRPDLSVVQIALEWYRNRV
jgi:hypothetical protein